MRMGELADSVLLTLSGVTQFISRLEREGLVRREPCPEDRRGACAILTEAELDRLGEAHSTHLAGVHKLFLEHFAEVELKTMAEYWRRVGVVRKHHNEGSIGMLLDLPRNSPSTSCGE